MPSTSFVYYPRVEVSGKTCAGGDRVITKVINNFPAKNICPRIKVSGKTLFCHLSEH